VASAYGWVTIVILSMVKREHPLYSNNKLGHFAKDCWFRKKYPREGKHHASTDEDDESKIN
jgi:hypothetical protein